MPDDYNKPLTFTPGSVDCNRKAFIPMAEEIKKTIACSKQAIADMCEIGRYSLITPVLNEAAIKAEKEITHSPQHRLWNGVLAQGYPDWALMFGDLPIFIVEAKQTIDTDAVAQTTLQMFEAYVRMRPEGNTDKWVMYGMLTTAVEVMFIKALFCGKQCDGIWRSENVLQVPHHERMSTDNYIDGALPVIQHTVWMLNEQTQQLKDRGVCSQ
jgi:hypothetical protein